MHDYKIKKTVQRVVVLTQTNASDYERFLVIFSSGESELFEFSKVDDSLTWIESEKTREHDCELRGCDFNIKLGLIVTADKNGVIRIWTHEKVFLREIQFPDEIESLCFLNEDGDLLVSHSRRISKISFISYWSKVFDYFGITTAKEHPILSVLAKEEEGVFDDPDFRMEQQQPRMIKITSQVMMQKVLDGKVDRQSNTPNLPQKQQESAVLKVPVKMQNEQSRYSINQSQDLREVKQSSAKKILRSSQNAPLPAASQPVSSPATATLDHSNLVTANASVYTHTRSAEEEAERAHEEMLRGMTQDQRRLYVKNKLATMNPSAITALPRSQALPKVGVIQPLPGVSYLATSPTYYEMMAQRMHGAKKFGPNQTRRQITESRITSNIMSFNQPVAMIDNTQMEVSCEYQTQVSQSKY